MSGSIQRSVLRVGIVSLSLLFLSCANQQPPDGGPPDTTTPEIISTLPAQGSLRVLSPRIILEFSKYVDERSFEESIFISPYVGQLEFDWSGREVEIRFGLPLRAKTTYVVNIGTDVKDLKSPSNRMSQAFTLAFSTGDSIDRGTINGKVHAAKFGGDPSGAMVFAYSLQGNRADTLNPHTAAPDYISQTGMGGRFTFNHIAFGRYRVFAIRDEYRNLVYDPEVDEFGIPSREIVLSESDTAAREIILQLAVEDTTGPRLTKVEATNVRHLSLEFSEDIDTATASLESFQARDTLSGKNLKLISIFPQGGKLNQFVGETEPQDSTATYDLAAILHDLAGNEILSTARHFVFSGSGRKDSIPTRLAAISLKDSASGIDLLPRFVATYSNAVLSSSVKNAWHFQEQGGVELQLSISRTSDVHFIVAPIQALQSVTHYVLKHTGNAIRGIAGGESRDSVRTFRFETVDAELLSSLEGVVRFRSVGIGRSNLVVRAFNIAKRDAQQLMTNANEFGEFRFLNLDAGKYVLQAYADENRNGVFDPGKPFPFVKSEPISDFSDTLKVRARWPLEGVVLNFR